LISTSTLEKIKQLSQVMISLHWFHSQLKGSREEVSSLLTVIHDGDHLTLDCYLSLFSRVLVTHIKCSVLIRGE
jgi:hypothetical protein